MFIKIEDELYINTHNVMSIEIMNLSDFATEDSPSSEVGFKIAFVTNVPEEYVVMKHSCKDKECEIEKDVGITPKVYFLSKTFATSDEAENWIVTNISDIQVIEKNKIN